MNTNWTMIGTGRNDTQCSFAKVEGGSSNYSVALWHLKLNA